MTIFQLNEESFVRGIRKLVVKEALLQLQPHRLGLNFDESVKCLYNFRFKHLTLGGIVDFGRILSLQIVLGYHVAFGGVHGGLAHADSL